MIRPRPAEAITRWLALIPLAAVACGPAVLWHGRGPDRRLEVRVEERWRTQRVFINGVAGPAFDAVGFEGLSISPDGSKVAYPALDDDRWHMVVQGPQGLEKGSAWDGLAETAWSGDGRHLAYAAERERGWYVVLDLDEEVGARWDGIRRDSLALSHDGRRLLFAAEKGKSLYIVADRRPFGPFDGIAGLSISDDGRSWGCVVLEDGQQRAVVNGEKGPAHHRIRSLDLAPGGRWGYLAEDDDRWVAVVDSTERSAEGEAAEAFRFGPRGRRFSYVLQTQLGFSVIVDDEVGPAFDEVEPAVFSDDGERWGYIGRRHDESVVILEGVPIAVEPWAGNLRLSPDGQELAYIAERDGETMVVHPGGTTSFDVVVTGTLVFSDDGEHWACLVGDAERRELFVTIDGTRRRPFNLAELVAARMQAGTLPAREEVEEERLVAWIRAELALALEDRSI